MFKTGRVYKGGVGGNKYISCERTRDKKILHCSPKWFTTLRSFLLSFKYSIDACHSGKKREKNTSQAAAVPQRPHGDTKGINQIVCCCFPRILSVCKNNMTWLSIEEHDWGSRGRAGFFMAHLREASNGRNNLGGPTTTTATSRLMSTYKIEEEETINKRKVRQHVERQLR